MLPEAYSRYIELQETIGAGSFGRVHKGKWGTRVVAIKDISMTDENQPYLLEAAQLSRASHPNIVQIFGTIVKAPSFYIIMEYADGGTLHQTLHKYRTDSYSITASLSWARQCAKGIAYLHATKPKPVIHRDIKPANLLLFQNKTKLKIGDFGTAREKSSVMTIGRGSTVYVAPEVFTTTSYDEKCDVYSWAIVLWEILAREQPFEEYDNQFAIMFNVHNEQRPSIDRENLTEPLKALLIQCWQQDPALRPSMETVAEEVTLMRNDLPGAGEPSNNEAAEAN